MNIDAYNSRYFNTFVINKKSVIKSSTELKKISSEYYQYYLMPKKLRKFFVKPTKFKIALGVASYKMKRYHVLDLGQQFVSEKFSNEEFEKALSGIFNFLNLCKKYSKSENVRAQSQSLVLGKTLNRIKSFKKISNSTMLNAKVDTLFFRIYRAYLFYVSERKDWLAIASHGDLCFSNILWDHNKIKLIDPRGALDKSEFYLDEYYDLAKLSQSILGHYDFVVLDKPQIDTTEKENIFKEYLLKQQISTNLLRVYEASLFLSMIPLHINNMSHVIKFIDKSDEILKEIGF